MRRFRKPRLDLHSNLRDVLDVDCLRTFGVEGVAETLQRVRERSKGTHQKTEEVLASEKTSENNL